MEKLPEWAENLLKQGAAQPQGLNLAFRLKREIAMDLVLREVVARWPQIEQALQTVPSIHYARFVPSYDARALMLIAEYDGSLDELIPALASALGDVVLDGLLDHVQGAPQPPIKKNSEKFREFVLFWNRVPILPPGDIDETRLPADFAFPVYCSYPALTAADIRKLPEQPLPLRQAAEPLEVGPVPDWARSWLHRTGRPAQGLNLALVLESPMAMPLMLWEVIAAQPKIQHALDSLSFLHFARFVPSYDAKALMVITEFDGPLEPYVMDFAIALGDVFDRLLGYVKKKDRPTLPVRNHPDEFWRFVREWNRVPFMVPGNDSAMRLPHDFEYRIYSAYPNKTVIDITGPNRRSLPQPALDKDAAKVSPADVQGNILKGYGSFTANHLFFQVTNVAAARSWLSRVLPDPNMPWRGITSAESWAGRPEKPDPLVNVAFTFSGMQALLPERHKELARFPAEFREGARMRAIGNGDVDDVNECAQWLFGRDDQRIHVAVSIHTFSFDPDHPPSGVTATPGNAATWAKFMNATQQLQAAAESSGLKFVYMHSAQAIAGRKEYFGFKDDISQPRISGQCPAGHAPDFQPASSVGEFLLGPEYQDIYGGASSGDMPEDLALNGTFGALRLLEQHVDTYQQMIDLYAKQNNVKRQEIESQLMGRSTEGKPVEASTDAGLNAFDYAPSWEYPGAAAAEPHCPVGAHIRRANPRSSRVAGQSHSRRLIRRGMPTSWLENGKPKKGLLGLFLCASLSRQFEFIQRQWIQGDLATTGIRGTSDPIAALRRQPTTFSLQIAGGQTSTLSVPPLLTTRGSLYLFFPGIGTLKGLDQKRRS